MAETDIKRGLEHAVEMLSGSPNILLPFMLSYLATFSILIATAYLAFSHVDISDPLAVQAFAASNAFSLVLLAALDVLLMLMIRAFFDAMAYGMCREAWQKGHVLVHRGWRYGFRHMLQFVGVDLLFGLAVLLTFLVFLVPMTVFAAESAVMVILFALLGLALLIVVIGLSVGFFWVKASLVAEGKRLEESMRQAWKFAYDNLFDTVFLIILFVAISALVPSLHVAVNRIPWPSGFMGTVTSTFTDAIFLLLAFALAAFTFAAKLSIYMAARRTPRSSPRSRKR